MTNEEAREFFTKLIGCSHTVRETDCISKDSCDECEYDYDSDAWGDAMQVALETLEKRIPKKPTNDATLRHLATCPTCSNVVSESVGKGIYALTQYCKFCGQKLEV